MPSTSCRLVHFEGRLLPDQDTPPLSSLRNTPWAHGDRDERGVADVSAEGDDTLLHVRADGGRADLGVCGRQYPPDRP